MSVRTEIQEPFCTVLQTLPELLLEVLLVYRRKDSGFNLRFSSYLTPLGEKKKVREEAKYTRVVLFFAHKDTKHQYGRRTGGMKLAGMQGRKDCAWNLNSK
jgi:hypothetical protein